MPLVTWKDEYSVGIVRLDLQHKTMVEMINRLYEAMSEGHGNNVLGEILGKLIAYTRTHFSTEEELFSRFGYPAAKEHKAEHEFLIAKAHEWKNQFQSGNQMLAVQVANTLKSWLVNHIQQSDQQYAPFLQSKGVR
ncbi:MAG: hypothetical protein Kow001_20340 [Acidobacteriota bacterium]